MDFLVYLSDFMIPLVIFYVVGIGLLQKNNVYDDFVEGAESGFKIVGEILPTLVGLMMATGILRASGALDMFSAFINPLTEKLGLASEVVPLIVVKMFSSSAATGLLLDLYKEFGPDSYIGRLGSILMSCSETIFYTMSVYFMTANVKKTRYTLPGALLATLAGIAATIVLMNIYASFVKNVAIAFIKW